MERIPSRITSILLLFLIYTANSEEDEVTRSLVKFLEKLAPGNAEIVQYLGWNVSTDPCGGKWKNVTCNNRTNSVRKIALEGLPLGGSVDTSLLCTPKSLAVVSLRNNGLTGNVPPEISNCSILTHLLLSDNRLSGSLPSSLSQLRNLKRLDISNNSFSGELPPGVAKISGLVTFLAEYNRLNGSIPEFDWENLQNFNVSYNQFSGPLPPNSGILGRDSVLGNSGLCGELLNVSCPPTPSSKEHESKRKENKAVMYSGYLILCLAFVIFAAYHIFKRKKKNAYNAKKNDKPKSSTSSSGFKTGTRSEYSFATSADQSPATNRGSTSLVVLKNGSVDELKFEELLKAPAELLGRGRFGSLYRVMMNGGIELAVKRIKDWTVSGPEFGRRMERIDGARHPRVLSAVAFYCSKQEKLVVYEYKPNGSLFNLLHGSEKGSAFDWRSRLNVASGIAEGLAFMHKDLYELGIGHGNLKSSNIIMDTNMDPLISEYGLLAIPKQNVTENSGSSNGRKSVNPVNDSAMKADIYGFGVILLEMLTGKLVQNNGFDLAQWVHSVVREEWTVEVFDKSLIAEGVSEERMVRLLQVALKCIDPSVDERPPMSQVAKMIYQLTEEEEDNSSIVSEFDSKT